MSRPINSRFSLLPFLSSFLTLSAFPNGNLSYAAWIALVPLVYTLRSDPTFERGSGFLTGWMSGTAAYAGILSWLLPTFQAAHKPTALACLSLLVLSLYMGLYWGVWSMFLKKLPQGNPFLLSVYGGASWVALEYLRTWMFSGFPWTLLADTQIHHLPLIQMSAWTGAYGVSFLIVLVNVSLGWLILHRHDLGENLRRSVWVFFSLFCVAGAFLGGKQVLAQGSVPAQSRSLQVALLQGNIDQYKKWSRAYIAEIQERYGYLVEEASLEKPDLIIWPETSVPGFLFQDPELKDWAVQVIKKSRTNHLVGSPSEKSKDIYNSSFSLDRESSLVGQYEKRHLVPFGEIVPWMSVLGRLIPPLNALGGFTAGSTPPVVTAANIPIGVNICYEAIFPALVRRSVLAGAQILANQTNDGWYMQTAAPYQHWAPNVFRAVENRRYVLRANNTGISGIIDPWGRIVAQSPIYQSQVIRGTVHPMLELTFYTRHGDLFAIACSVFCIGILGLAILGRL